MRLFTKYSTITKSVCFMVIASVFLQAFIGCAASNRTDGVGGRKYQYIYQLVEPVMSTKMEHKDANVSITFTIDDAAISYTLLNLTQQQLLVESAAASIAVDNKYIPARNIQSLYSDSLRAFAPIIIGSRGYLQDILIPRTHIYWDGKNGWAEKDLFPTLDSGTVSGRKIVTQNIGKKIDIVLPIKVGEKRIEYKFGFKVVAIKAVPPSAPIVEKQRPPGPMLLGAVLIDTWLTIGIVSGVAIISSIFILSSKKPVGPLN